MNSVKHFYLSFLFLPLIVTWGYSQKVTVSSEINVRSDLSFHILGKMGENIVLYRDQGTDRKILLYDNDLVLQSERQINLINKRAEVYELVNQDTAFFIFYGFREKGEAIIQLDVFSPTAELKDSIELSREDRSFKSLNFESILSENESKLALYQILDKDKIRLLVFDFNQREVILNDEYLIKNIDLYDDLVQIELSDDGDFLLLTETNNFKNSKENHTAHVFRFYLNKVGADEITIPLENIVTADLRLAFDNKNKQITVIGLYDEKRKTESSGFLWVTGKLNTWSNELIHLAPFNEVLLFELYGEKKKKRIENFKISDVFWKNNGTPIIVLEMSTDIRRQRGGGTAVANRGFRDYPRGYTGWSDHYREDLLLLSLDSKANIDWHQVFYKKQFSQNDQAIFSSYFPFVTPSRIRLLFNDEIKPNSTVSEYIFDGNGNFKRTSVLSTEYQNLKLRFQDAVQVSNTELLIPSQKNYSLNIVKVDYSR